jgi:UDP-2-acetamido-2,6-beta-L-arabino-hexul-4-ose reductase
MKVAISGIGGFIGTHLKNYLSAYKEIEILPISKETFNNSAALVAIVKQADVFVHLAALNRDPDPDVLYKTNVHLVGKLVEACYESKANPYIIFASSLQESEDNPYGHSKNAGQRLFEEWASCNHGKFAGLVIPNVFGPFGKPFYNSVIATFCYQLARNENPTILEDKEIQLIYVNELARQVWALIRNPKYGRILVPYQFQMKVSSLLAKLQGIKESYMDKRELPAINTPLELDLFNTFRCYIPHEYYPVKFKKNTDDRGSFIEIMRNSSGGQFSFSTTKPGVTRGNHYHTRKSERFAVIKGEARIQIRRIDQDTIIEYFVNGETPSYLDMPIWHTHNITNIGKEELITLFWINEPYDVEDPDTFMMQV